jgi:hypothetical protein
MMIITTKKKVLPGELLPLLLELGAGDDAACGLLPGWNAPPGGCTGLGLGLNPGGLPPTGGPLGGFSKGGLTPLMNCTPHFGHFSGGKSPRPASAPQLLHVQILTISSGPFGIPG